MTKAKPVKKKSKKVNKLKEWCSKNIPKTFIQEKGKYSAHPEIWFLKVLVMFLIIWTLMLVHLNYLAGGTSPSIGLEMFVGAFNLIIIALFFYTIVMRRVWGEYYGYVFFIIQFFMSILFFRSTPLIMYYTLFVLFFAFCIFIKQRKHFIH